MQRVRTLRDHDTAEGMRHEGDEYVRSNADAEHLAALSVVEILGPLGTEGPGERSAEPAQAEPT